MEEKIRIRCKAATTIDIDELVEFQGDLKKLSTDSYEALKDDILTLGFISPIHVWEGQEKKYILDGHQRLKTLQAMKKEGYAIPEVPVTWVEADSLKEAKKQVLSLTSQFGEMTYAGLNQFLSDANLEVEEVMTNFRFPEIDFNEFIKKYSNEGEEGPDPDEAPAIPKVPKSKPGELYELGPHKAICGDATNKADIAKLMGQDLIDMVITDPPYNVDYEGKDGMKIKNDKMGNTQFKEFLFKSYKNYFDFAKPACPMYVFHADSEGENFRWGMRESGWAVKQCLVWVKSAFVMGRQDYQWQHEPCLYGWKPGAKHPWYSDRKQSTVVHFDRPKVNDVHPTKKPVEMLSYFIENSSKGQDIIADFFGGSGSTLMACEKTKRKCRTVEFDPIYMDVILDRWCEYTKQEAYRVEDDGAKTAWSEIKNMTDSKP